MTVVQNAVYEVR